MYDFALEKISSEIQTENVTCGHIWDELDFVFNLFCLQVTSNAFWRDLFFNFFCMFWGEFDSIFTFFCMQVTLMMFWIEFDLLFAFFYMQLITKVFCIVLDNISTFFCMQLITIVFWTVLDLIFILFCVQVIYMLFWGGVGFDLHPLLLESDHREVLDWLDLRLLLHAGDYWLPWCSGLSWTLSVPSACRWSTCLSGGRLTLSSPSSACRRAS